MSKEAQSANGRMSNPQNAIGVSSNRQQKNSGTSRRNNFAARQTILRSIKDRVIQSGKFPTSSDLVGHPNLHTGFIRKSGQSRKDLLAHVMRSRELMASEYVWRNPSVLRYVKTSQLGEGKDMTLQRNIDNIQKKREKGITNFVVYKFDYKGKAWTVKTAQHRRGYETLYHIQ